MINMDDLTSLSWEQKKKYRAAIGYGYFDDFEDNPREWRHKFVGCFLWKNPHRCATVNKLKEIVGRNPEWEDLTDEVLTDFVNEKSEEMTASSLKTLCAELKAVLRANRRKVPSEDYVTILTLKNEVSQAVYLTQNEIQRIINYKPVGHIEMIVRRNFLVECMTGARRCDAEKLTIDNCNIETGTLSFVPDKTPGIVVTVPVYERLGLRKLLAEVYGHSCDLSTFNEVLRRICMNCGINAVCSITRRGKTVTAPKYEFVSSHTGRRSFATNLYLAGVSIEDIAVLMGHGKNIETTKRYICADKRMSSNVMAYFQGLTVDTYSEDIAC